MFFSYEGALREAKRMGDGYTIKKQWYGWIVVDSFKSIQERYPDHNTDSDECWCSPEIEVIEGVNIIIHREPH